MRLNHILRACTATTVSMEKTRRIEDLEKRLCEAARVAAALAQGLSDKQARIAALEAALKPLAEIARLNDTPWEGLHIKKAQTPDDHVVVIHRVLDSHRLDEQRATITMGMCRKARDLLKSLSP